MNVLWLFEVIGYIRKNFSRHQIIIDGQGVSCQRGNLLGEYPDIKHFPSVKEVDDY
jgi:hypothetical protein